MDDIKQKTKIGMLWNSLEKVTIQLISFILNIILARLLTPNDYGTVGMLTIFLNFSSDFIDSGFSKALIQKQNRTGNDFSTVFFFNLTVSCLLYIILFFAAPLISNFYKKPELLNLQRVLFLVLIINSLSVVHSTRLQIKVDYKTIAIINSSSTIIAGIIGIFSAYKGLGPWALVIKSLANAFCITVFYWISTHWHPDSFFSKKSFKSLFGFSYKLLFSELIKTTTNNINSLIIGKVYDADSLGYYTKAQQFPTLISGTMNSIISGSTFPLLASLQNERNELVQTLKKLIKITAMAVFPAMFGIAILSKPMILFMLGEKWLDSASLLFWLAFSFMFNPLQALNINVLNAIGRSDLVLKTDLIQIPVVILSIVITFPISMKAVVIGKLVTSVIYFMTSAFFVGRIYKFGFIKQLSSCWKYLLSSVIMCLLIVIITNNISSAAMKTILGVMIGIVTYTGSVLLLRDEEALKLLQKLRKRK